MNICVYMCVYVYVCIIFITFLNLKVWKTFLSMVQNPEAIQEENEIFDTKINLCMNYLIQTNP